MGGHCPPFPIINWCVGRTEDSSAQSGGEEKAAGQPAAPSTYLSLSSFMGMPQQTNTPPPASTTFTLLPHTLQRYSCPTAMAMLVLLVGFSLLTPGTKAPERQRRMFNLEAVQVRRR